jgi:hypothetical protein
MRMATCILVRPFPLACDDMNMKTDIDSYACHFQIASNWGNDVSICNTVFLYLDTSPNGAIGWGAHATRLALALLTL